MKLYKFYGPPGTGKTHRLISRVKAYARRGIPYHKIGYFAFTRKAAAEARERIGVNRKEIPYFQTLHAFCFHLLGLKEEDILQPYHYEELGRSLGIRVNYSDKYTFRPSYSNQLQNVFYDTPIRNEVARFKGGKINIKQLASELDNIATKFKRNFPDIEVAELKLNKNNKFSFKKDFPSITKDSRLNKIALTRNAINELENAYVVSSAGAMDDTKFNQLKKDYNFVNEKYRNIYNPVFTQENIEIIKTRPTLRNKILKIK